jgi:hypothetical protein
MPARTEAAKVLADSLEEYGYEAVDMPADVILLAIKASDEKPDDDDDKDDEPEEDEAA